MTDLSALEAYSVPSADRPRLLQSIASTVADFRSGELPPISPEHVDRWISQFDEAVQVPMLEALDYAFRRSYLSRAMAADHFRLVVNTPNQFRMQLPRGWEDVTFLRIQQRGQSQAVYLSLIDDLLYEQHGLSTYSCVTSSDTCVYVDDALFSGGHVRADLQGWLMHEAPQRATVYIVLLVDHTTGHAYTHGHLRNIADGVGKVIRFIWARPMRRYEDRTYIAECDVLRPKEIPNDPDVIAYVRGTLGEETPLLRRPGTLGQMFVSESTRHILEQELLKAGAYIKLRSPYLNEYQRPLGNRTAPGLGFGSLVVTYRNCPNNCPLAFWAGDRFWQPLFERKNN